MTALPGPLTGQDCPGTRPGIIYLQITSEKYTYAAT